MIQMVNPKGEVVTVDAKQVKSLLKSGYKLYEPKDEDAQPEKPAKQPKSKPSKEMEDKVNEAKEQINPENTQQGLDDIAKLNGGDVKGPGPIS